MILADWLRLYSLLGWTNQGRQPSGNWRLRCRHCKHFRSYSSRELTRTATLIDAVNHHLCHVHHPKRHHR